MRGFLTHFKLKEQWPNRSLD